MMKIVVFTGAGISAESGLKTFRDSGGLWENYSIEDVASIQGWHRNPQVVLDFYNARRKQAFHAQPNAGHKALVELEKHFDVHIVTQNVDALHEKAGSSKVLHLHGELHKVRSTANANLIYELGEKEIQLGDVAEDGQQLRPHIVWFGEAVPMYEQAERLCETADMLLVVGTSLQVYPAAGLVNVVDNTIPVYLIDPNEPPSRFLRKNTNFIQDTAARGLPLLVDQLIKENKKAEA